jgi:Rrf2 family protein
LRLCHATARRAPVAALGAKRDKALRRGAEVRYVSGSTDRNETAPAMISLKTKYAIKALVTLAEGQAAGIESMRIEEIARRSGTPKRFLEHILLEVKRAGLIGSRRGREGGYALIKDPRTIAIGAILRLVDGPMAPLPCLSRKAYQRCADCPDEQTCRIREVFGSVFANYLLLIESLTLADLLTGDSPLQGRADLAASD